MKIAVLTISDKGARGERIDESGPAAQRMLRELGEITYYEIIPDEQEVIQERLLELCDEGVDLIVTTGGTGVAPRDVTPEATLAVIERRVAGMETLMLLEGLKHTPAAAISRAVVGTRGRTLIINLPGSPRAVEENLSPLLPILPHALEKLQGAEGECKDVQERFRRLRL